MGYVSGARRMSASSKQMCYVKLQDQAAISASGASWEIPRPIRGAEMMMVGVDQKSILKSVLKV